MLALRKAAPCGRLYIGLACQTAEPSSLDAQGAPNLNSFSLICGLINSGSSLAQVRARQVDE